MGFESEWGSASLCSSLLLTWIGVNVQPCAEASLYLTGTDISWIVLSFLSAQWVLLLLCALPVNDQFTKYWSFFGIRLLQRKPNQNFPLTTFVIDQYK